VGQNLPPALQKKIGGDPSPITTVERGRLDGNSLGVPQPEWYVDGPSS
jgi:hypothetical protein